MENLKEFSVGFSVFFQCKFLHHSNNRQAAHCVMTMPLTGDSKSKSKTCLTGSRTFERLNACTNMEHDHPLYVDIILYMLLTHWVKLETNFTSKSYIQCSFFFPFGKAKTLCKAYKRNLEKNEPKLSHFEEKNLKLPYLDNKFLEGAKYNRILF